MVGTQCAGRVYSDPALIATLKLRDMGNGKGMGVYVGSFSVSPDVMKPLAEVTSYLSMTAAALAVGASLLTSSAVGGAASEIQALGVFSRMYSCTSPRVASYFGDLRIMSPLYMPIFGDELKSEYLGVLMGNLCFCVLILLLQLLVVVILRLCGNKDKYFSTARFPSITLGAMFSVHTGTVFAASKLLRLADPDNNIDYSKFYIPASIGVAYYAALPVLLIVVAWRFIPRSFYTYDITKFSKENQKSTHLFKWFIPVGVMKPDETRRAFGAYVSSFRRASHHWCSSHVWASTLIGIIGFATLDNENNTSGSCFLWGILIGILLLLLAIYYAIRLPKRHLAFNVVDVVLLVTLALLFGFTITWRQIFYPPQHRVAESSNENLNWPDLAVIVLGWLVIGLTIVKVLLAVFIWFLEERLLRTNPPMYKLWALAGGTINTTHRRELSRVPEDGMVLSEMYTLAVGESPSRENGSGGAKAGAPTTPLKESTATTKPSTKFERDAYAKVDTDDFFDDLLVVSEPAGRSRMSRLSMIRPRGESLTQQQRSHVVPIDDDDDLGLELEEQLQPISTPTKAEVDSTQAPDPNFSDPEESSPPPKSVPPKRTLPKRKPAKKPAPTEDLDDDGL